MGRLKPADKFPLSVQNANKFTDLQWERLWGHWVHKRRAFLM